MEKLFSKSKDMSTEYCISVVRLGEIQPVENSDFLGKVLVNGRDIIVRKDTTHEGDVMFYASNECQLNEDFLSVNNLFEDIEHNSNFEEVNKWLEQNVDATEEDRKIYLQSHRGYFDKHGRVRMKKLRGVLSMGYLFGKDELIRWCPFAKDIVLDDFVGEDFDTVNGELFVKAYVPPIKEGTPRGSRDGKRNKKLAKFDRIIPGQFSFHYDTQQLNKEISRIKPDDVLSISIKLHGTSAIFGNVLTKKPKWKGLYEKVFLYLPKCLQFTYEDYDVVYSSRTVIKNQYINRKVNGGFYGSDVWSEYYDVLKEYIPKGMIIYGEIVGYVGGSNSMIQKGFDYKCNPGENKLMIYRISQHNEDGTKTEWNVQDVYDWTIQLKQKLKDNGDLNHERIHPIDIVYHGTLKDLYPEINVENHWHENVLEAMKNDAEHFGMEKNEPLCRNKTPREGIVVRIDNDAINEAFKLKCLKFLGKEAEEMDKGETTDIEMLERYEQ